MGPFDSRPGHTHCVFRRGTSWFALPAVSVREVLFRPAIVAVPHSDPLLAGLCHVRSEFLPVLRLDAMLTDDLVSLPPEAQMLVVTGADCTWALLVDQVAALASLETSVAREVALDDPWSATLVGWAAYQEQLVRVLDPNGFYRLAERILEAFWVDRPGECRRDDGAEQALRQVACDESFTTTKPDSPARLPDSIPTQV